MLKLGHTNEPYEVIALLDELNILINTLAKLTDTKYYMDYIFNGWSGTDQLLTDIGVNEGYIQDTLMKFEKLRIALFGDSVDWEELVVRDMRRVAESERRSNQNKDSVIQKLEYQLRQCAKGDK